MKTEREREREREREGHVVIELGVVWSRGISLRLNFARHRKLCDKCQSLTRFVCADKCISGIKVCLKFGNYSIYTILQ
jgi:hypothetical protein